MRKTLVFVIFCAMLLTLFACSGEKKELSVPLADGKVIVSGESSIPTDVKPDMTGRVTRISRTAEGAELLVENDIYSFSGTGEQLYRKAVVRIDERTAIADSDKYLSTAQLTAGMPVEVWFSGDPAADSFPVLVYAQAVRVTGEDENDNVFGITNLPQMTVTSGSTYLSVVTFVKWSGETRNNAALRELMSNNIGACVSAGSGDQLTLSFSMQPDSFTVAYSDSPESTPVTLELIDGSKVSVPSSQKDLYFRVDAFLGDIQVEYAFMVDVIK